MGATNPRHLANCPGGPEESGDRPRAHPALPHAASQSIALEFNPGFNPFPKPAQPVNRVAGSAGLRKADLIDRVRSKRPVPDNPLLTPSTLAYHLPPFALIRDEHYLPAYEQGMAEQLAEVAAIA